MLRALKQLFSKWSVPGWLLLFFDLFVHILDWADRIQSFTAKVTRMMPWLRPIVEFLVSPLGQLTTLIVGLALLYIATWRKFDKTPILADRPREPQERRPAAASPPSNLSGVAQRVFFSGGESRPRLAAEIWDETLDLWKESTNLIERWTKSGSSDDPPLAETADWINRFEIFARKNLSLEQLKIVFDPFDDFSRDLPSAIKPTPEISEVWRKLAAYESHLQAYMRDDLRRPPPQPPAPPASRGHITKWVDEFNARQRRKHEEDLRRKAKRNEVLEQIGELIRERRREKPDTNLQNMLGFLVQAGAHRLDDEAEVSTVCDELVAAGNEHPFQIFDKEHSPVIKGEWLEFLKAFYVSGHEFKDSSAWGFAVTHWRGKDRWLTRPKPESRSIEWTNKEKVEEPAPIPPRTFIIKTPHELLALYQGRTALQADKSMESYKGFWIETEAAVSFLARDNEGSVAALRTIMNDAIECRFDKKWNDALARVNHGDSLKVCGKISPHQNGQQLYLLECELLT